MPFDILFANESSGYAFPLEHQFERNAVSSTEV